MSYRHDTHTRHGDCDVSANWSICRYSKAVIVARGEIDIAAVPVLRKVLTDALCDHSRLVVDLSEATFLDTWALDVLVIARQIAEAGGGGLRLNAPSRSVRRMLEACGVADLSVTGLQPDLSGDPVVEPG